MRRPQLQKCLLDIRTSIGEMIAGTFALPTDENFLITSVLPANPELGADNLIFVEKGGKVGQARGGAATTS